MYTQDWYYTLNKPLLAPPDYIFAPVWTILYLLIFLSLFLYLNTKNPNKKSGYFYFGVQMILNLLWSPIFFILKNIALGFIIIVLMDVFIYLNVKKFYSVSKLSGALLVPYFIWVLFATYLNFGYLLLN